MSKYYDEVVQQCKLGNRATADDMMVELKHVSGITALTDDWASWEDVMNTSDIPFINR